uniref:ATP synthase F0 subunit 8 n=1 Tax=Ornithodoros tartakovskyi TaxID=570969 RepID=UPI0022378245|nr:ATP synthase F0 subunit 8 [Ornithodoros tartakovskyi]UYB78668.1 ATP synthase F0 subunit 8 [Ornithodoros tartakovskyi]UYB78681.1 ATP synthase F0 subunit 8 [Ornithodoros tartakovskyi]
MPQLYPMNWSILLMFFLINISIIFMFLYFIPLKYSFKKNQIIKMFLGKNWKW